MRFILRLLTFLTFLALFLCTIMNIDSSIVVKEEQRVASFISEGSRISAEIPILRVSDSVVYYPEFEFYLMSTRQELAREFGTKWKDLEKNFTQLMMDAVIEEIIQLKIIVREAKARGISIPEKEREEILATARVQLSNIDPLLKVKYYLNEELLGKIYEENFIGVKFFNSYKKEKEIGELQAKKMFKREYRRWKKASDLVIYEKNLAKITH